MEQFFIDAITALCKQFGYDYLTDHQGIRIKNKSVDDTIVEEVIAYFNGLTNSKFRATNKETIKLIGKLVANGFTTEDLKAVILAKHNEWKDNAEMRKFIRPITLFNINKFERYLEEADNANNNTSMFNLLKDDWNE